MAENKTPKHAKAATDAGAAHVHESAPAPDPEQVLANLDLAAQIMNQNLAQQNAIQHEQALANLRLAAVGKCAELILAIDPKSPDAPDLLRQYKELMELFMEKLDPRRHGSKGKG